MIGNDIVDLRLARFQSNWKRKGWLDKVFTPTEREFIKLAKNPSFLVWKFWSMKEAVYKANQRLFPSQPVFSPKSFECSLEGGVSVKNKYYITTTTSNEQYIHTIAQSNSVAVNFGVFKDLSNAKPELLGFLASSHNVLLSDCTICKDQYNMPYIRIGGVSEKTNFSLSHHGGFSAFAVCL